MVNSWRSEAGLFPYSQPRDILQTPPVNGEAAGAVDTSVAFPAGWNNTKPWFMGQGARSGASSQPEQLPGGQSALVKPTMPPPPFPSQPWQGSRLGPLPPVGPLAQRPVMADLVCCLMQQEQHCISSVLET